jgi:hypothetical protein
VRAAGARRGSTEDVSEGSVPALGRLAIAAAEVSSLLRTVSCHSDLWCARLRRVNSGHAPALEGESGCSSVGAQAEGGMLVLI